MKYRLIIGVSVLCTFFVLTLGVAFLYNKDFPVLVVATESSVGTWLSGVLLSCCATIALINSVHQRLYPWILLSLFFFLLTADEHFMFHERLKEWIMFSFPGSHVLIRELPVVIGAVAGGCLSWILWHHSKRKTRILLILAVMLGIVSVALDIIGSSALWEECLKLFAELSVTSALLVETDPISNQ